MDTACSALLFPDHDARSGSNYSSLKEVTHAFRHASFRHAASSPAAEKPEVCCGIHQEAWLGFGQQFSVHKTCQCLPLHGTDPCHGLGP